MNDVLGPMALRLGRCIYGVGRHVCVAYMVCRCRKHTAQVFVKMNVYDLLCMFNKDYSFRVSLHLILKTIDMLMAWIVHLLSCMTQHRRHTSPR